MESTRYHRDQAELCLEMAGHMSDLLAADLIRKAAARHFAQALELEKQAGHSQTPREPEKRPDDFSDSFYRAIQTGIGESLRNQLAATEPAPERLLKALQALDSGGDTG
jgi:hypothetical protein